MRIRPFQFVSCVLVCCSQMHASEPVSLQAKSEQPSVVPRSPSKPRGTTPSPPSPEKQPDAKKPASANRPKIDIRQLVKQAEPEEWVVRPRIQATTRSGPDNLFGQAAGIMIEADTAEVFFPYLKKSTSHQQRAPRRPGPQDGFHYSVQIGSRVLESGDLPTTQLLGTSNYLKWSLADIKCNVVKLELQLPVKCWDTTFEAAQAEKVPWPALWPKEASDTFSDKQPYGDGVFLIDHESDAVKKLLDLYCKHLPPKNAPPVRLARELAGKVIEDFQQISRGDRVKRLGGAANDALPDPAKHGAAAYFCGELIQNVDQTIRSGRGTEHDINCLLVALYRAANLPARIVIGYECEDPDRKHKGGPRGQSLPDRSWFEFALADDTGAIVWVPVDIARQRSTGVNKAPAGAQAWKYFGDNPDLSSVVPLSYHFGPPVAGAETPVPSLWGWKTSPRQVYCVTTFNISAIHPPK